MNLHKSIFTQNSKKLFISSSVTATFSIFLLEIVRLYGPLLNINNKINQNIFSIIIYIIGPIIISYLMTEKGTFTEEIYQGSIYALTSWFFWICMITIYLILKTIVWTTESIILSLDYVLPLVGLFFIFFSVGGLSGSIFHHIRSM
jgi:hypothetical protein